ncbi:hypothetical protein Q7C36_019777 [Tachysurus vachellii]|uniref:Uncharacterized protein n=1 Tax=Tachysurus vachellii TaxID=175792 RepID=A0AA88LSE9_TACVA|nr:hypothetical protein Q7C36_019777 [Tachysurus vachellii]
MLQCLKSHVITCTRPVRNCGSSSQDLQIYAEESKQLFEGSNPTDSATLSNAIPVETTGIVMWKLFEWTGLGRLLRAESGI